MSTKTHTELPTAVYSFLPSFSGDGYGYGGGAVVTFGDFSIQFGEGPRCHELAKKVTGAVNSHDALVAALRDLNHAIEELAISANHEMRVNAWDRIDAAQKATRAVLSSIGAKP